jgi:hypothetical protein
MSGLGTKLTIAKSCIRELKRVLGAEAATIEYCKSRKQKKIKIVARTPEEALKIFRYVKNSDKPIN